jgi:hypothetical protein
VKNKKIAGGECVNLKFWRDNIVNMWGPKGNKLPLPIPGGAMGDIHIFHTFLQVECNVDNTANHYNKTATHFHNYTISTHGILFLLSPSPEAIGFACVSPEPWCAKGWHSASVLIIICYRQKPIKVSRRSFTFCGNFAFCASRDSVDRKTGFIVWST